MKKRICAVLTATCFTCFTLTALAACNEGKTPPDASDGGMSATEWSNAVSPFNFLNFTLTQSGRSITYENGAVTESVRQTLVMKFDADAFSISGTIVSDGSNGNSGNSSNNGNAVTTAVKNTVFGDEAEDYKRTHTEIVFLFISDYDSFVYDAAKNVYTISDSAAKNEVIDGELCTLLLESGTLSFSAAGKVKTFTCNYTQTLESGKKIVSETTWLFSAYDLTEIEVPDEEGDSSPVYPDEMPDGKISIGNR